MTITLSEKYRPKTLNDIESQKHVTDTLTSYLKNKSIPHILCYGPAGVGKTSCIHALAREMYGERNMKSMMLELNGSDDRGISVIRTQVKNFSRLKNITCPELPKLIILDEADSMTFDAQSALRRVMEKNTENVRFCLICNYINKLIPALQSRCTVFRFSSVKYEDVKVLLTRICDTEGINICKEILEELVDLSRGDLRRCLNFLESYRMKSHIERDDVLQYYFSLNNVGMDLVEKLVSETNQSMFDVHNSLKDIQTDFRLSLENLLDVITHIALRKKKYRLLSRLANIEYLFFKSHHTFEGIFLRSLASVMVE